MNPANLKRAIGEVRSAALLVIDTIDEFAKAQHAADQIEAAPPSLGRLRGTWYAEAEHGAERTEYALGALQEAARAISLLRGDEQDPEAAPLIERALKAVAELLDVARTMRGMAAAAAKRAARQIGERAA